ARVVPMPQPPAPTQGGLAPRMTLPVIATSLNSPVDRPLTEVLGKTPERCTTKRLPTSEKETRTKPAKKLGFATAIRTMSGAPDVRSVLAGDTEAWCKRATT